MKKEWIRSLKFLLFSASAGLIQIGSYSLLYEVAGLEEWISYLISLVLSVIWNFTLNRRYTFQSANNIPVAMLKVAVFYLIFTPASTGLEWALTEKLQWSGYIATAVNMILNFVLEFLYDRFYVFRDSIDTNDRAKTK